MELGRGIGWSVLFMLAAIFGVAGFIVALVVRQVRSEGKRQGR